MRSIRTSGGRSVAEKGYSRAVQARWSRFIDRRSSDLSFDWAVAAAVVFGHLFVFSRLHRLDVLSWSKAADRVAFYQIAAAVTGIIVGFAIAALAFFYTVEPGRRVKYTRQAAGGHLRRVWIGALTGPLVAALIFLVAIAVDNPNAHNAGVRWAVEGGLIIVVLRLARLVWLFSSLLSLSADDDAEAVHGERRVEVHGPRPSPSVLSASLPARSEPKVRSGT